MKSVQIIGDNYDTEKYNAVANHPLQSWEWGEARKDMGIDVLRIGEYDTDVLHNVFQITFHTIPYTPFKIGYVPRSAIPSSEVIQLIHDEGKKRNAIFVKFEPDELKGAKIDKILKKSSHPLFPDWTQVLDLSASEDELLQKMKPKTRYNIKLAEKKGVLVTEATNTHGFHIFSDLYFKTTERQRYKGHTRKYHQIIFDRLHKDISHILIASFQEEPLAAYHLFLFKDILYYPYGGSSHAHRNFMAPHLLMWEVIKFGKSHGAKKFDMWGSLPAGYSETDPWSGFTRFKEGFGSRFVQFVGSYDLVIDSIMYPIYNLAYRVRKALL